MISVVFFLSWIFANCFFAVINQLLSVFWILTVGLHTKLISEVTYKLF